MGGAQFPVTAATTNSLFQDADPALYHAIRFFSAMITTHVGARVVAEAAAVGADVTAAVASRFAWDPAPLLTSVQAKLPMLAMHRKSSTILEVTLAHKRRVTTCDVTYVLPPLKGAEMQRLVPALQMVGVILRDRCERGSDPTYTPPVVGGTAGQNVWALCGIDRVEFVAESFGAYADVDRDLYFPSWTGNLRLTERTMNVSSDFLALTSIEDAIDLDPPTGATISDFVAVTSDTTEE